MARVVDKRVVGWWPLLSQLASHYKLQRYYCDIRGSGLKIIRSYLSTLANTYVRTYVLVCISC